MLRLSFAGLVAHFRAQQRERQRMEQLHTAMARVHRDRTLRHLCLNALREHTRMTRAKMLAVHRQHNYCSIRRVTLAWKTALRQSRRYLEHKVRQAEPNARRLLLRCECHARL